MARMAAFRPLGPPDDHNGARNIANRSAARSRIWSGKGSSGVDEEGLSDARKNK